MVIIDGDNLEASLKKLNLSLCDLRQFIVSLLRKKEECLIKLTNREGILLNPVIYITTRMMEDYDRMQQVEQLNSLKQSCGDFVKLEVIDPKKSNSNHWNSCTDSVVATYIAMALYDTEVNKIIVVSGDGDFLRPLQKIGVINKEIAMVAVEGSSSLALMNFVEAHKGGVHIIRSQGNGIINVQINKKTKYPKRGYDNFANPRVKR